MLMAYEKKKHAYIIVLLLEEEMVLPSKIEIGRRDRMERNTEKLR
jgi:hypothetical protein